MIMTIEILNLKYYELLTYLRARPEAEAAKSAAAQTSSAE